MALLQGDNPRAMELEQTSLWDFRALGVDVGIALTLLNQGHSLQARGMAEQAASLYEQSLHLAQSLESLWLAGLCLVGFASLSALSDHDRSGSAVERAARLLGAAEAFVEKGGELMSHAHRVQYDRQVVAARAQLDERSFALAWAEGQAMTLEQAIAYALEEAPDA